MPETHYTWKQIEKMVKCGRLTEKQKNKIFTSQGGGESPIINQRDFRRRFGERSVPVSKLGKVFDELLGHAEATSTQKSYFSHLSKPEVLKKHMQKEAAGHGGASSKKMQAKLMHGKPGGSPKHSTDVQRLRQEARMSSYERHSTPRPMRPASHAAASRYHPPFMPH